MVKVAVAGVGGLGHHIVNAIRATGKHEVVVLSRRKKEQLERDGVKVEEVDYDDPASLERALKGVEAVISTLVSLDHTLFDAQVALIKACLATGVRRFAPSEFEGSPYARTDRIEFQKYKRQVLEYLAVEVDRSQLEWTVFSIGGLYDFMGPLRADGKTLCSSDSLDPIGFSPIVDLQHCRAEVPEGAQERRVRFVLADDVGRSVARCLDLEQWPEQIRISGANPTCGELIQIAEGIKGKPFTVEVKTKEQILSEIGEAQKQNDLFNLFKAGMALCVLEGDYGWESDAAGGVEISDLFPTEKLTSLEEYLKTWWGPD
ncbi:MAG: hypothetical protein M1837_001391 [Sclerophora amabilis]|nr:MAG: hypothetical protein M1837_001391 [Sclerophora amabilis]